MQKRYDSIDILRGLTIAFMVTVNNPGSPRERYAQLCHSPWSGCTLCDLVFPFFLFCAGAAMAFSLARYSSFTTSAVRKVLRRGLLIFMLGLALNMFQPHRSWADMIEHLRIFGVLQRIALCYIAGGLLALWLRSPRYLAIASASLLLLHWGVLYCFGPHPGWDTLEGNISGAIDIFLVGPSHVYQGYGIPFDPEGVLGVLSGTGTLLLGYIAGHIIRNSSSPLDASASIFAFSGICLAIGCIWNPWFAINKPLWSGSYVFFSAGWALFALAFLIYCVDVHKWGAVFTPFRIMGLNPLTLYVAIAVVVKLLGRTLLPWYYNSCCVKLLGDGPFASLVYALTLAGLMFLLALVLYRRKIVIKL